MGALCLPYTHCTMRHWRLWAKGCAGCVHARRMPVSRKKYTFASETVTHNRNHNSSCFCCICARTDYRVFPTSESVWICVFGSRVCDSKSLMGMKKPLIRKHSMSLCMILGWWEIDLTTNFNPFNSFERIQNFFFQEPSKLKKNYSWYHRTICLINLILMI